MSLVQQCLLVQRCTCPALQPNQRQRLRQADVLWKSMSVCERQHFDELAVQYSAMQTQALRESRQELLHRRSLLQSRTQQEAQHSQGRNVLSAARLSSEELEMLKSAYERERSHVSRFRGPSRSTTRRSCRAHRRGPCCLAASLARHGQGKQDQSSKVAQASGGAKGLLPECSVSGSRRSRLLALHVVVCQTLTTGGSIASHGGGRCWSLHDVSH